MKRFVVLLCMIASLAGCGFKPRGDVPLAPPLYKLYLKTADPYGQLARNLRDYLKSSGVYLAACPSDADTVLEIMSEQISQTLLSVGGTQLTRQYNLILTVIFQITDPLGQSLLPPQIITETRTLPIRSSQVLAGSNEANFLYRQMRLSVANNIMYRLSSDNVTNTLMNTP